MMTGGVMRNKSEFGKGLTYCLALFLCHSEREVRGLESTNEKLDGKFKDLYKNKEYSFVTEMWFNGSSDHLYDLVIPEDMSEYLKNRLSRFRKKVLNWGHGFNSDVTKEDKAWAIQEAKDIIRLIDKSYGVDTERGEWE